MANFKKFLLCIAGILCCLNIQADSNTEKEDNPEPPVYIPIIVRKDIPVKHPRIPAKGIDVICMKTGSILMITTDGSISVCTAEVEQLSPQYGYWTSTSDDAESCEMYFDGTCGDYKLTLSDGETTYTGYFSL